MTLEPSKMASKRKSKMPTKQSSLLNSLSRFGRKEGASKPVTSATCIDLDDSDPVNGRQYDSVIISLFFIASFSTNLLAPRAWS